MITPCEIVDLYREIVCRYVVRMLLFFLEQICVSMHIAGIILRFVEEKSCDTNNVLCILYNFSYMGQNNTAWYRVLE